MRNLKYGIICDGPMLKAWQSAVIDDLAKDQYIKLVLIIKVPYEQKNKDSFNRNLCDKRKSILSSSQIWNYYYNNFFLKYSKAMKNIKIKKEYNDISQIRFSIKSDKKRSKQIDETDIFFLKKYNLDFVINFTLNRLSGKILEIPTYGIWEFNFGNFSQRSYFPPFYREFKKKIKTSEATLYRATNDRKNDDVLFSGRFKTLLHSYTLNFDLISYHCVEWPRKICRKILAGVNDITKHRIKKLDNKVLKLPGNLETIYFFMVCTIKKIETHLKELFVTEDWSIGILNCSISDYIKNPKAYSVSWITPNNKQFYWADPFILNKDSKEYIFFEEYDYIKKKGYISAGTVEGNEFKNITKNVFNLDCHTSYPYILEVDNTVFCIPETSALDKVILFQEEKLPDKWRQVATLVNNFPATDPTVFHWNGIWWLFCGKDDPYFSTKLYAWYARSLTGPWLEHRSNPIKVDVRSARPAGKPFTMNGSLFRPSQDCSRTYGGAIVINKIIKLTIDEFEEIPIMSIEPNKASKSEKGFHTLSFSEKRIFIDKKRHIFLKSTFIDQFQEKAKRISSFLN